MKSQANGLLKVAQSVLSDYIASYPHDKLDAARDFERLSRLIEERGLGVFTLDLPALDGSLVRGLESGRLIVDGALSKRASKTILVPRIFRGLWLRIFNRDGDLKEDVDTSCIFLLRQLLCLGKSLEIPCSKERISSALKEYERVEQEAAKPSLDWDGDDLDPRDDLSFDDYRSSRGDRQYTFDILPDYSGCDEGVYLPKDIFRRLQSNFDAFSVALGEFDVDQLLSAENLRGIGFKHGPGAVADQKGGQCKYDFPNWPVKLEGVFPFRFYGSLLSSTASFIGWQYALQLTPLKWENLGGYGLDRIWDTHFGDSRAPARHEPASRLLAVPKTAKGPRLIAAEPVAHQWCQQMVKLFLEERLIGLFDDNFISFKRQDLSQKLVIQASLDRSLATVDLSSASDRLSCRVIERAFRKNKSLLRALHSSRTRWNRNSILSDREPRFLRLKKFASQGTAVTFPVQSIFFLIVALTCSGFRASGPEDFLCNKFFCKGLGRFRNKVRVFGDDIIIPVHGYDLLRSVLHVLGLKVNQEKTFLQGYFRESCGMDSFKGDNVTPIKCKTIEATGPQSRQSLIDYSNNLFKAGLWHAAKTVESTIPRWVLSNLSVIGIDMGGVGLVSFCGESHDHLDSRYNEKLHRYEFRRYSLTGRVQRKPTNSLSGVLQYFSEAPSPMDKWVHGIPGRPKSSDGLRWETLY